MTKQEMARQSLGEGQIEKSAQERSELIARCYEQEMHIKRYVLSPHPGCWLDYFYKKMVDMEYF